MKYLLAALLLLPMPALAETELHIDPALCKYATEYKQDPGIEYKAAEGVDLNPSPLNATLGKELTINLTTDLASQLSIPSSLWGSEVQLGVVKLVGNEVTFNGVILNNSAPTDWQAACEAASRKLSTQP